MFKRIALALTFITAFTAAGLSFNSSAEAWRSWGRPYANYYYGPRVYRYGYSAPYRTYYPYGTYYRGPVVVRPYYNAYYGPGYYYGGPIYR